MIGCVLTASGHIRSDDNTTSSSFSLFLPFLPFFVLLFSPPFFVSFLFIPQICFHQSFSCVRPFASPGGKRRRAGFFFPRFSSWPSWPITALDATAFRFERGGATIEPIACILNPHTWTRWRRRVPCHRPDSVVALIVINKMNNNEIWIANWR